ncbi:MAG TPA: transglutaminase-like domain-containing protein [Acidimicrobiales bacterium]|nr:transglutaminase-like domain-containing protein [Acidimicrobiales bacterium]
MDATDRFAELVRGPADALRLSLDEAALLIAAHARPEHDPLDVPAYLGRLDALAASCADPSADAVLDRLFVVEGFTGDTETYYDARNSYLDQVIERRRGIPITLSIVLVEVGRRLGVPFQPIGMPGHFLVRLGGQFIDPFEGGRFLSLEECADRFRSLYGDDVPFDATMLAPAEPLDIVARMLANLRQVHLSRKDSVNLEWVLRLRGLLPTASIEERAERAGVLAALGRFDTAADVLEDLVPDADDERARALASKAKQLRARLN